MTQLPSELEKLAHQHAANATSSPRDKFDIFMLACNWLYSTLLERVEKLDEKYMFDWFAATPNAEDFKLIMAGANIQYGKNKATIQALREEVQRLHDKYDFQLLCKERDALREENGRLLEELKQLKKESGKGGADE